MSFNLELTPTIDPARLATVQAISLAHGSHDAPDAGDPIDACVMEAVAYVAGEPWGYAPECACPVITAFCVGWNDGLPTDADRDRLLKPLIPQIVGTRSTPAAEQRRAVMAADWLIRSYTPAWLRAANLDKQADLLAALPELTDFAQCPSLMPALEAVRDDAAAARDVARDAAWDAARAAAWGTAKYAATRGALEPTAAWDAAWAAAKYAARGAAWDAAWGAAQYASRGAAWRVAWRAARAAALDAAWGTAWGAALDAAWGAAWGALEPTVVELQSSAQDLLRRMCAVTE